MAGIPNNDVSVGSHALTYWHNEALQFPDNYDLSFSELQAQVNSQSPAFFEGFGMAIRESGVSDSQVEKVMEKIADDGEGRFPAHWVDFFNALSNEATEINFVDAVKETVAGSATDLSNGLVQVGQSVIQTAKNAGGLLTLVPLLLFLGAGFYIFEKAKR